MDFEENGAVFVQDHLAQMLLCGGILRIHHLPLIDQNHSTEI
jgi:hypothetical protein